ncbi:MAG: bifunctional phosphopantothenoylcysteine decarboxylase/phosphopantothenate synthase [Leucobacter sp.]
MNIVLGVTGGIAAYKAVSLARLLVLAGHEVHVVPTEDALKFVGLPTWEAISRNPVTVSVHEDVPEVRHVRLGQQADLVIVAPATANTLARMNAGIADDLLGTTLLATQAPVLVAPAMHTEMWQHPATQHNVAVLRSRGVHFIGPDSGQLTGADSGPGRMSEPEAIALEAEQLLGSSELNGTASGGAAAADLAAESPAAANSAANSAAKDLAGIRILVSAGGTREPIDPVRFIGNRSSGRQGVAIAAAAAARGADVVLVTANVEQAVLDGFNVVGSNVDGFEVDSFNVGGRDVEGAIHPRVRHVRVGTAAELQTAVEAEVTAKSAAVDIVIMAAAVADYRVKTVADGKLRKEDDPGTPPTIELVENPDILAGLVRDHRRPGRVFVGFAAETVESADELVERGKRKRARKGVDLLAVNAVGWSEGFEADDNSLTFINATDTVTSTAKGSKREVADALLTEVLAILP